MPFEAHTTPSQKTGEIAPAGLLYVRTVHECLRYVKFALDRRGRNGYDSVMGKEPQWQIN